jgi:hypothetical protein
LSLHISALFLVVLKDHISFTYFRRANISFLALFSFVT